MKNNKVNDLASRRNASAGAKGALLKAHRAAKEAAEPTRLERQEERLALSAARDERSVERMQAKTEERRRLKEETALQEAAAEATARAELDAQKLDQETRIARGLQDQAEKKAQRDRRYANRKARQS